MSLNMSLDAELPSAVRYLVPGLVGGIASFAFSRVMIEPVIAAAIDYEGAREHAAAQLVDGDHSHGHELFTRSVQANVGSAVGIIVMSIAMGVLFVVAYRVLRAALERGGYRPGPAALALVLSTGMFVAIALVPALKYPANPPAVGLEETVAARSSAFLTMTVVSVVAAGAAVAAGLALSRRLGVGRACVLSVGGYLVVTVVAMALLPSFHEVPGPLSGPDGMVLDGFPAGVLADFRVYSLLNQAIMWLAIGATWAALATRGFQPRSSASRSQAALSAATS